MDQQVTRTYGGLPVFADQLFHLGNQSIKVDGLGFVLIAADTDGCLASLRDRMGGDSDDRDLP